MSDVLKVGRYQLENLVREGVRFLFVDLRTEAERSTWTDPLLSKAMPLAFQELQENLISNAVPVDSAIVLLSEDGTSATAAALGLEAGGFTNVYIVRDGVAGLRA
jgi:rhodanese-related sulfurtransferase